MNKEKQAYLRIFRWMPFTFFVPGLLFFSWLFVQATTRVRLTETLPGFVDFLFLVTFIFSPFVFFFFLSRGLSFSKKVLFFFAYFLFPIFFIVWSLIKSLI